MTGPRILRRPRNLDALLPCLIGSMAFTCLRARRRRRSQPHTASSLGNVGEHAVPFVLIEHAGPGLAAFDEAEIAIEVGDVFRRTLRQEAAIRTSASAVPKRRTEAKTITVRIVSSR